jgi:hypothetical protein
MNTLSPFKLLLTTALFILIIRLDGHCQNTVKIHAEVTKYLNNNLNNPGSYKPVSWGKPEKDYYDFQFQSFADSNNVKAIPKLIAEQAILAKIKDERIKAQVYTNDLLRDTLYQRVSKRLVSDEKIIDSLKIAVANPKILHRYIFQGYTILHTFRATNAYNALMLTTYVFYCDKNLKVKRMVTLEDDSKAKYGSQ